MPIAWPAWRDFLGAYAQASRSRPLLGRSLFLLAGCPPPDEPAAEVGVVDMTWDGSVDNVDLLLFANEKLRERTPDPLLRSLLANTVARVAAWDYDSAAILVAENDQTIMDPTEVLRAIAKEQGLGPPTHRSIGDLAPPPGPASPTPCGRPSRIHLWKSSAVYGALNWPCCCRGSRSVATTWWRATCTKSSSQMRADGDGQGDPYDIEVGELYALFARRGGHRGIRKTLQCLRDGRNVLAHRRHLSRHRVLGLIASLTGAV